MENKTSLPKKILPFIWHFIRPELKTVIIVMLCPLIWAVITSANPYVLKMVIDTVVDFSGEPKDVWTVAAMPVALFIFLQVVLDLAMRLEEWTQLLIIPPIKARMRAKMFDYAMQHSHRYFQDHMAGTLSNKVLDMVRGFENMFISVSSTFLPITLSALISVMLLWTVHVWFAIFVLAWFAFYLLFTAYFSMRCVQVSDEHSEANSELSGKIVDAFRNMATIRLFGRRRFENSYLNKYQEAEVNRARRLGIELIKVHFFQGIASTLLFCMTLVLFIIAWQKGWVTIGDFTFIMTTTFSLLILTWWMASQFVVFFKEIGVSRQALSIINVPHEITDAPEAKPLKLHSGKIEFDNVTFNYFPNKNIFQEKSIVIEPGEKVGLVGFSGSGKTTFLYLILRFFDVLEGRILIDGQDIKKVTQQSLREQIAIIPQDTMLFHRSLMDNIRYGKENATEEEVIDASIKAACHDFIQELEDGYDSLVGEGGIKLSGGQRQRIAIARAILKNAPILILDEATSALDTATERQIQKSLWKVMQGRTAIVIAHRLSTLSMLDRILVFDDGVIIEEGTHAELLMAGGHYAHLWELQSDGFLPDKQTKQKELLPVR